MKILVVCQHYWPEPYPLQDLCEEMVRRGHEVQVITGVPNYPRGYIFPDYRWGKNRKQEHNGVKIRRTFTIGRRNNLVFRFLNYFSFAISSALYAYFLKEEFDVVFANQTSPVMMSGGALAYGKRRRKKVLLYCMDLWPASLAAGGIRQNSLIYRIFGKISGWIYRGADRILITSQSFREYLCRTFQIEDDRIGYHPQYSNISDWNCEENAHDTVNLMFAGNMGAAQQLPTILGAAKLLESHRQLRWHFVGDGSELENSKALAQKLGLTNVIFHGRKPQEEMPHYYAMADAMLLTLTADPFISMTLPGKAQTYMAAGKPIIGAANGEIARTIAESGCGFCAEAEDERGLAEMVVRFLECPDREQLGKNARKYYEERFSRARFMDALEKELAQQCAIDERM